MSSLQLCIFELDITCCLYLVEKNWLEKGEHLSMTILTYNSYRLFVQDFRRL